MEPFWDTVVFRICCGLGEGDYRGLASQASRRLLQLAFERGRFTSADLQPLSRLLVLQSCPSTCPLFQQAAEDYLRRFPAGDQAADLNLGRTLQVALPLPLVDLALARYWGEASPASVIDRVVRVQWLPQLVIFLARLTLMNYQPLLQIGRTYFVPPPLAVLGYEDIVEDRLISPLYARVLADGWPISDAWPDPPPVWRERLHPAEREFLDRCLALSPGERCLLYLSLYGVLSCQQIAEALAVQGRPRKAHQVANHLEKIWSHVL